MPAVYFVSADGSDGGSGTSEQAWRTLQHAADRVAAGDTVIVRAGDYAGFDLRSDGTASAPITFLGEAAARITTRNPRTPDGINLEGADHVVIDGFTVVNQPRAGIRAVLGGGSPVETASPTTYLEARLAAGAALEVPASDDELAFYVVSGTVTVEEQRLAGPTLVVFARGAAARVAATDGPAHGVLLGGAPLGHREIYWNFVSSSARKIEAAKRAWRTDDQAVFPHIPDETGRVPLPETFR